MYFFYLNFFSIFICACDYFVFVVSLVFIIISYKIKPMINFFFNSMYIFVCVLSFFPLVVVIFHFYFLWFILCPGGWLFLVFFRFWIQFITISLFLIYQQYFTIFYEKTWTKTLGYVIGIHLSKFVLFCFLFLFSFFFSCPFFVCFYFIIY